MKLCLKTIIMTNHKTKTTIRITRIAKMQTTVITATIATTTAKTVATTITTKITTITTTIITTISNYCELRKEEIMNLLFFL